MAFHSEYWCIDMNSNLFKYADVDLDLVLGV